MGPLLPQLQIGQMGWRQRKRKREEKEETDKEKEEESAKKDLDYFPPSPVYVPTYKEDPF